MTEEMLEKTDQPVRHTVHSEQHHTPMVMSPPVGMISVWGSRATEVLCPNNHHGSDQLPQAGRLLVHLVAIHYSSIQPSDEQRSLLNHTAVFSPE